MVRPSRRRRIRVLQGALALAALLATAGVVAAHDVGGSRFDAPLPPWMLYGGSGLTVAVTAAWLGYADDSRRIGTRSLATVPAELAGPLRSVARLGFFLAVVAAVAHGLVGKQAPAENLATVFVWPVWLKGVGLWSLLAGSPWRTLSPWETVYDGLELLEGDRIALLGEYPDRLGHWPALLAFAVGVGVVENLTVIPRDPRLTVLVVVGYALAMVLGGLAFGREWFRRADALAVLYRLFGRVAPIAVRPDSDGATRIELRPPWRACTDPLADGSLVAFAVATVYTVSFDGFTDLAAYQTVLFAVRDLLGTGPGTGALLYVVGLAGAVAAFLVASAIAELLGAPGSGEGGQTAGTTATDGGSSGTDGSTGDGGSSAVDGSATDGGSRESSVRTATLGFAATVLPIAGAYEVAHNYPYVLRNLGQTATVVGDLLVGSGPTVGILSWLPLPAFWGSQVVLVVAGHVVAVVAAHRVAVGRYEAGRPARRGHLPMVLVMVAYTVISLWIVSQPVIQ